MARFHCESCVKVSQQCLLLYIACQSEQVGLEISKSFQRWLYHLQASGLPRQCAQVCVLEDHL